MFKQPLTSLAVCCAAAMSLSVAIMPAMAQESGRMITVYGHASRDVVPNQANVHITLKSEDKDLAKAKNLNDAKLRKLYEIAGNQQIEKRHLKTSYSSVQPRYRYMENRQILEGYEATMSIIMTVTSLDTLASLLQELTQTGVLIDNVGYSIDKEQLLRDEVMLEALDNAREKAEKMASRLDQTIGEPLQISEGYSRHERPQPVAMMAKSSMMAEAPMAPPSGEQEVEATVTVSFELQ